MKPELEKLFANYVRDLTSAVDVATARWKVLGHSDKYNSLGFIYDRIWPAGISGDPAILRVIRKYFLASGSLIEQSLDGEAARRDTDAEKAEFGIADEGESEDPSTPHEFLFIILAEREPRIAYKIRNLGFIPVGFEDHLAISRGGSRYGNS